MPNNHHDHKDYKPLYPIATGFNPQGCLPKKVKAILFDIYGTLFISGSGDIASTAKSLKKTHLLGPLLKHFSIKEPAEKILNLFFSTIQETHAVLKKDGIDFPEIEIDRIWMEVLGINDRNKARQFAASYEMIVNPVFPMPNLLETLIFFRDKKIPMGIVSNAQFFTLELFSEFLNAVPEELGFDPDLIFLSYRYGYAKPSLFLFQKAVSALAERNITPDAAAYAGNDMLNDIYTARKAEFQTVLFAGDKRSLRLREEDPRCKNLTPDIVITDLIQLIDHIA
jgi:putative hydrolase of the HAD superfamily